MNTNQDKVKEAELRKAVRRALAQLFKDIANHPTLVIELPETEYSVSTQSVNDILEWLFRRR